MTYESINEVWIMFTYDHGVELILFMFIMTFMDNHVG